MVNATMAESYGVPGRTCSVAEYVAQENRGQVFEAWAGFCDCMFTVQGEKTEFLSGGNVLIWCSAGRCYDATRNNLELVGINPAQAAAITLEHANTRGAQYELRVRFHMERTPDWYLCVNNWCGDPNGCPHPVIPNYKMPWNPIMGPGAPWTLIGAATRGIPQRTKETFLVDVAQFFTIRIADYAPLRLWQTFWTNPTLFGILMAKITLVPIAGAPYATAITGASGVPWPLIPFAIDECKMKGLDPVKEVWEAMGKGILKIGGVALQFIGGGFGIFLQVAAQDQIDSGEIERVRDPYMRATIVFLSKSGLQLVQAVAKIAESGPINFARVFGILHDGFKAVGQIQDLPLVVKGVVSILVDVLKVAQTIADGIYAGKTALQIADDVCEALLGFRPSVFFAMVKAGDQKAAVNMGKTALETAGKTVEGAIEKVDAISGMLDKVIRAIEELGTKWSIDVSNIVNGINELNAGVTESTGQIRAVAVDVSSTTKEVLAGNAQAAAQLAASAQAKFSAIRPGGFTGGAGRAIAASTPLRSSSTTVDSMRTVLSPLNRTASSQPGIVARPPAGTVTVTVNPTRQLPVRSVPGPLERAIPVVPQGGGAGPILAGAAAGFFLGGPVGAAVGAGAALLTSKKK